MTMTSSAISISATPTPGIFLWTLRNKAGLEARITNLGAAVTHLFVPDVSGRTADVVLGYDRPEDYADNPAYFGCVVGRFANRIAGARFSLNGRDYHLEANQGANALHGGRTGFSRRIWRLAGTEEGIEPSLSLAYFSPAGEEGYPGDLTVNLTYTLTRSGLRLDYRAEAAQDTIVNLTHHGYFNLLGESHGSVLGHRLRILADRYLPTGDDHLPTGIIAAVAGSPFDFRSGQTIGDCVDDLRKTCQEGPRFNVCYALEGRGGLKPVAILEAPDGRRRMTVHTTEPGLMVYPGSYLGGTAGKGGTPYADYAGVALETQHWPDAPNHPDFPSTTLRAGQCLESTTLYEFEFPQPQGEHS